MPETPDILLARAGAHYRAGRYDAAADCVLEIVAQVPNHFDALHLLGVLCLVRGQRADSFCYLTRASRLLPDQTQMNLNLTNACLALKLFSRAEEISRAVVSRHPDSINAWNNLGISLREQQRGEEALVAYRTALTLEPDNLPALSNLGNALADLGRHQEAADAFRAALAGIGDDPASAERAAELLNALSLTLVNLDRPEEALVLFQNETSRGRKTLNLEWNLSLLLLQLGDYGAGWRAFESRLGIKGHDKPRADATIIDIKAVSGKRILLTGEQGRGDVIQFVRYASLLSDQGATVYLSVYDDLKRLLSGMRGVAQVVGEDDYEPAYDMVTPLLSLPLAFGTLIRTIPAQVPYLCADPERVAVWRERVGPKTDLRVGLAWSSTNPRPERAAQFSVVRPLLDCTKTSFHMLQKVVSAEEMQIIESDGRMRDYRAELTDFAETAALIEALDLVITIDTGVAHLAGALGKPVWIMLPFVAEWRWLRHREDSPWYPTARLFRQSAPGDWNGVVTRIALALSQPRARLGRASGRKPKPLSFARLDRSFA